MSEYLFVTLSYVNIIHSGVTAAIKKVLAANHKYECPRQLLDLNKGINCVVMKL